MPVGAAMATTRTASNKIPFLTAHTTPLGIKSPNLKGEANLKGEGLYVYLKNWV